MTDLSAVLPPPGRSNTTLLHDLHPEDHNEIVDAINALDTASSAVEATNAYRIYASTVLRNADATAHVPGMLSWVGGTEATLAVWESDGWHTLVQPTVNFNPRLWIGTAELTFVPVTGYVSTYRNEGGLCRFRISARFGGLAGASPGTLALMAPLPPMVGSFTYIAEPDPGVPEFITGTVSSGTFGMAYAVVPDLGAIGGIGGVYDGTVTLSGASGAGELAIVMPGTAGLMERADMGSGTGSIAGGAPGEFDVFLAGVYWTLAL